MKRGDAVQFTEGEDDNGRTTALDVKVVARGQPVPKSAERELPAADRSKVTHETVGGGHEKGGRKAGKHGRDGGHGKGGRKAGKHGTGGKHGHRKGGGHGKGGQGKHGKHHHRARPYGGYSDGGYYDGGYYDGGYDSGDSGSYVDPPKRDRGPRKADDDGMGEFAAFYGKSAATAYAEYTQKKAGGRR
eukprot:gene8633-4359_t